jgi:hypothetical protein
MHRYAAFFGPADGQAIKGSYRCTETAVQAFIDREYNGSAISGLVVRKLDAPIHRQSRGPLSKQWVDLGSDVNWEDYGGLWGRPVKGEPDSWWVICFEPTHEWGDGAEDTYGKYYASLAKVDLTSDQLAGAWQYVGSDSADGLDEYGCAIPPHVFAAMKAEALHGYGAKEVEAERNGNAAFRIMVELAAEARGSE